MPRPVDLDDMIYELDRELRIRKGVYQRACAEGRMNRMQADRRLDVMQAVLDKLKGERDANARPSPTLV